MAATIWHSIEMGMTMTDSSPISTVVRMPDGRFGVGSGGRIPGTKNRISNEALMAVRSMKDEAITQLRSKLERGEWDAIVFVLSRILPKDRPLMLDDPSPDSIASALANGEISPEEGRAVATAFAHLKDIDQVDELRNRLAELEARVADR